MPETWLEQLCESYPKPNSGKCVQIALYDTASSPLYPTPAVMCDRPPVAWPLSISGHVEASATRDLARTPVSKKSHGVESIAQLQGLHPGTRAGFINSKLPDRRPREAARVLMEALRKQCPEQVEADSCCPESVLARCKVSTPSLEDCARGCVLRGPSPRRWAPEPNKSSLSKFAAHLIRGTWPKSPETWLEQLCESYPKPNSGKLV